MSYLGINRALNMIRSRCSVDEIIPEEQKAIDEALIDQGKETTYFPSEYKVNLVVSGSMGAEYAHNVLDAIIRSYCTFYTEKYIEQGLTLNPSKDLLKSGYDYYESVEILENDTLDMLDYLKTKRESAPNYRSSATGYSYADLYDIYKILYDYEVPLLYATVMTGPQVRDGDVLLKKLQNKISNSEIDESVKKERRDYLESLIKNYSSKNEDILNFHNNRTGGADGGDYILRNVYDDNEGNSKEITYDSLILEYVGLDKVLSENKIRRDFDKSLLSVFSKIGPGGNGSEESHDNVAEMINKYEQSMSDFYDIVSKTSLEHNQSLVADYLKTTNSIRVYPSINVKLYCAMSVVMFFILGCIAAIVVGRVKDFIEYFVYVDKKTGLANRDCIDVYVEKLEKTILPDNFTCMFFNLTSLSSITKKYGYTVGNNVLKDFGGLVGSIEDENTFVGFNGAGQFVAILHRCNPQKAEAIIDVFNQQTAEYNKLNPDYMMEYKIAFATSTDEKIYSVRELLRKAASKLFLPGQHYSNTEDE